jgi:hypothetical protein
MMTSKPPVGGVKSTDTMSSIVYSFINANYVFNMAIGKTTVNAPIVDARVPRCVKYDLTTQKGTGPAHLDLSQFIISIDLRTLTRG